MSFPNISSDIIVIRARWTWGGPRVVTAYTTDTVSDTLSRIDFINNTPDTDDLIFACKGQFLIGDVSLGHQGIKNGDTIVCNVVPRTGKCNHISCQSSNNSNHNSSNARNSLSKKQRFLDSLKPKAVIPSSQNLNAAELPTPIEIARNNEISRLNDLAFSAWETMPEYPMVLKEMLKSEEEANEMSSQFQISQPNEFSGCGNSNNSINICEDNGFLSSGAFAAIDETRLFATKTVIPDNDDTENREMSELPLPNPFSRKSYIVGSAAMIKPNFGEISQTSNLNTTRNTAERKEPFSGHVFGEPKKSE